MVRVTVTARAVLVAALVCRCLRCETAGPLGRAISEACDADRRAVEGLD